MIKALIVDDEPIACRNLEKLLEEFKHEVIISGVAHNTTEAERKIKQLHPDALFLDIQMPNENAFQFLERLDNISFEIIFITAYDEFAIRAFKLNAVDYILKPINIKELEIAVAKLSERISFRQFQAAQKVPLNVLSHQINERVVQQQLILRNNAEFEIVPFHSILYIEAMGSYAKIFYLKDGSERSGVMSRPINEYEELLPDNLFFRTHKTFLINCNYIKKILKEEQAAVQLSNGVTIPVARRRYKRVIDFLKDHQLHHDTSL